MKIKGAIFDVDGTMLDSMPIWENVSSDFLISRGKQPRPDLNSDLRMLGGHQIPEYFQIEYGITETAPEIHNAIIGLLNDFYCNKAPLKDGVIEVLEALRGLGVNMCVATATDRYLIEPALERCGIDGFFERIFTCGEEETSKRFPDIYIRAAESLGTSIAETLVFEDALYAIRSAKGAGFPIVAVYDLSADSHQEEVRQLSDIYVKSMSDLNIEEIIGRL